MAIDTSYSSPHWSRRSGHPICMLVIHATAGTARSALRWLLDPLSHVSAHYLIDKSGRVYQLVPEEYAAFHAGQSRWRSLENINDISIGIGLENANSGYDPYPDQQIAALIELSQVLIARYRLQADHVVRHADIAIPAGRKTDPAGFPWERFKAQLFADLGPGASYPFPLPQAPPQSLAAVIREAAYRQIGVAYRPSWSTFRAAAQHGLGSPLGESFRLNQGQAYLIQPFGRDVLVSPLGDWESITRLSELIEDGVAPRLVDAIVRAMYERAGGPYVPASPLHEYAMREALGMPLKVGVGLEAAGGQWGVEIYPLDLLYCPGSSSQHVGRLSELTRGMYDRRPPQLSDRDMVLRTELLAQLFRSAGTDYHADWGLHQRAIAWEVGAPLSRPLRCSYGNRDYIAQPFALDVLYAPVGDWSHVERLGAS